MPRRNSDASPPPKRLAQAFALHERGRLAAAEDIYAAMLRQQPNHVETLYHFGILALQTGRVPLAVGLLARATTLDPRSAAEFGALGSGLMLLGRPEAAIASFDKSIELDPNAAEDHYNRGRALQELKSFDQAISSFDRAIAARPDFCDAYFNRGNSCQSIGKLEDAIVSFEQAIGVRPGFAEAWYNRGNAMRELRRYENAIDSYARAIAADPRHARAHSNRGVALQALDRHQQALADFDQAIALRPDYVEAHSNRGRVLHDLGRHSDALVSYDNALTLQPDFVDANWNKGVLLLLLGRFEAGWTHFEWRKRLDPPRGNRTFRQPPWLGQQDPTGKTIFIHWEQGFGDTIQFCRFAKRVQDMGATVILSVQRPLLRLICTLDPRIEVIAESEAPDRFDYHCPLASLPLALRTTLATIPSEPRYLSAAAEPCRYWRQLLSGVEPLKVGLVWAGSARQGDPGLELIDRRRSIPLAAFAPLARISGVSLVSLQKGPAAAQLRMPPAGLHLHDWNDQLEDFADTAALVDALDLVISVDTAVAHLAGALGKPVWLLNRFDTCWRWLLHRHDSPWYPTVRLFRQPAMGDWCSVIAGVRDQLRALAEASNAGVTAPGPRVG
ncbi:tetratricopeptide repeat protein [Rhodopila sp.]|uniref:tetratricopeptide repeat protein n=1 Tax=Rhodopila sp. TaxID=2480087 RepID=UPI003D1153DF